MTHEEKTHDDELEIIRDITADARIASLTTITAAGEPRSRPVALIEDEFNGILWFFTEDPSEKTQELRSNPRVNVAISSDKGYLSITGTATVSRDQAEIDRLWNPWAESWFEQGRDDPRVALIRVDASVVNYWDTDRPLVAKAYEFVKGLLQPQSPDMGDTGTVRM
ncbi:pyridoxamine 5'-phosphate oxidase family protein [Ruicaihuangia caeni]|uniref:pyridoxamine 5'-phosphate oxidase family protein n=1 Tax=Ruicaihuangia caeni TaxID=3042517 RepID=UPI00338FDDAD